MKKAFNYNKDTLKSLIIVAVLAYTILTPRSSSTPALQLYWGLTSQLTGTAQAGSMNWTSLKTTLPKNKLKLEAVSCSRLPCIYGKSWRSTSERVTQELCYQEEYWLKLQPNLDLHLPVPPSLGWISTLTQTGAGRDPTPLHVFNLLSNLYKPRSCFDENI